MKKADPTSFLLINRYWETEPVVSDKNILSSVILYVLRQIFQWRKDFFDFLSNSVDKNVYKDVRALLFYLKNCWPERWSENQEEKFSYDPPEDEKDL